MNNPPFFVNLLVLSYFPRTIIWCWTHLCYNFIKWRVYKLNVWFFQVVSSWHENLQSARNFPHAHCIVNCKLQNSASPSLSSCPYKVLLSACSYEMQKSVRETIVSRLRCTADCSCIYIFVGIFTSICKCIFKCIFFCICICKCICIFLKGGECEEEAW